MTEVRDPLAAVVAEMILAHEVISSMTGWTRCHCGLEFADSTELYQHSAQRVVAALRPHIDAEKQAAVGDVLLHQPVIAPCTDGTFGVYCSACSHEAQEYVYPCTARSEWDYPAILTAAGGGHPPTDPAGDP